MMVDKVKNILNRNLIIIVVSVILQGLWEYIVCGLFYDTESINNMTSLMVEATIGDVIITVTIFNLILIINRSGKHSLNFIDILIVCLYGFSAAMVFETRALAINRWVYSEIMGNFMGTGVGNIPILQLVLLLPLTFLIESSIVKFNNGRKGDQ